MKIKEPEVIYKSGKPTAVILPLAQYEEMLQQLEDVSDLRYLRKIRREGANFRPLEEFVKERKRRVSGRR